MGNRDFMQIVKRNLERIVNRNGWGQNILFIATENSSDLKGEIKDSRFREKNYFN